MTAEGVSFSDQVRAAAHALGFDAVGIARANVSLDQDFARYEAFLREGMHGDMGWLAKHGQVRARLDGEGVLAGAKSVICVARRYQDHHLPRSTVRSLAPLEHADDPRSSVRSLAPLERADHPRSTVRTLASLEHADDPRSSVRTLAPLERAEPTPEPEESLPDVVRAIARYARGRDYHRFLRRRLRRLAAFVRKLGNTDHPVRARPLCDEEPVLERAWAARAGLGFVGKNGMLIVPGVGSMVLLGEVVTTLELDADDPLPGRCGACTRCLEACPTGAFAAPFVLDARRCVSYLTIEHRGAIAEALRPGVGMRLFGCDDCQTVCPFNAATGARAPLAEGDGDPFRPLERWSRVQLEALLSLDASAWSALFEGTPLRRVGRAGIARNAAIVLANRKDASALPALRGAASGHEDPMVREAASWAAARIERESGSYSACAAPLDAT